MQALLSSVTLLLTIVLALVVGIYAGYGAVWGILTLMSPRRVRVEAPPATAAMQQIN